MARIFDDIWQGGKHKDLPVGHNYMQTIKQRVRSLIVPKGEIVTIYQNQDRSGKKFYSFYEGEYQHMAFHGVPHRPGLVKVEKTDLNSRDMVRIVDSINYAKGEYYQKNLKLPVGDWVAPDHFPDDTIDILYIPYGLCVEVFRDKTKSDSLVFDGQNPNGDTKVALKDYRYNKNISRIKVTADTWESAGIHLENEKFEDGAEWEAETVHISDISELADVSGNIAITAEVQESKEVSWDVRAGISAKAEFQFGPDYAQGTVGVEVSVEGGYGENESETTTRSVTRSIQVDTDGVGNVDATLMVRSGVMTADIVRMWRNKRTGATTETRGKVKIEKAGETRISIK